MVITAGDTKQFSVVLSAFSRCPLSISFSNSSRTVFWKWIGTGRPFCCIGLTSFFNWISMVRSLIVWLFLNKSSYSLMILFLLSSSAPWRITFVFLLPFNPISSLSSQSKPNSGWVFLFSVNKIGSISLLFSVFTLVRYYCPMRPLRLSGSRSWICKPWQNAPSFCSCCIVLSVPGKYVPWTSLTFRRSGSFCSIISFYRLVVSSASVIGSCVRLVRCLLNYLWNLFWLFWFWVFYRRTFCCNCRVLWSPILIVFSFYQLVTGSFVFNCGCEFVRDDFFCRYLPKVTLSLDIHKPLPIFI